MTPETLTTNESSNYSLEDAFDELPEHINFEPELIDLLSNALEIVERNNPERPYHNKDHAIIVMKRCFIIWKNLQRVLPYTFDDEGYEILAISAVYHDVDQDYLNPGENEYYSAEAAVAAMFNYPEEDKNRVRDSIITTVVCRNEDGIIEQQYIQEGSKDPLKLVLATADINGIALEGIPRMFEDVVSLYLEVNSVSKDASFLEHSKAIGKFLMSQASFLRTRIDAMINDIEYYFPSNTNKEQHDLVVHIMKELFKPGINAMSLAYILEVPGKVESILGTLSQSIGKIKEAPRTLLELLK